MNASHYVLGVAVNNEQLAFNNRWSSLGVSEHREDHPRCACRFKPPKQREGVWLEVLELTLKNYQPNYLATQD